MRKAVVPTATVYMACCPERVRILTKSDSEQQLLDSMSTSQSQFKCAN